MKMANTERTPDTARVPETTPTATPTTPARAQYRETIEVAVGPNVDGHEQQAIAAQTLPED